MAAFHNIETMFFAKCSIRICPIFPSLFPYYKTTTSTNPLYLQKEIQFCFAFLLKPGKNSPKFVLPRFTPFFFFSPRAQTGSFSPCRGIFPWMWVASLACNKCFEKCPRCTLDILGTCSSLCLPSRDLKIPTSLFVNLKPSNYSRKCAFVLFYSTLYANTFLSLSKSSATGYPFLLAN